MKKELKTREDIKLLVDTFYNTALKDEVIGFIFTDVAKIELQDHMPRMYDFWESTLLQKNSYKGNPMSVHLDLNQKQALEKIHFDRWLLLFNQAVDKLFSGEKAEQAKTRALSIATVMQIKIFNEMK
jgi:hemoglobin